jgi:hypothetical protein
MSAEENKAISKRAVELINAREWDELSDLVRTESSESDTDTYEMMWALCNAVPDLHLTL